MTRNDIIRMAHACNLGQVCGPLEMLLDHEWEDLHRFTALVATHEREICAKVCEELEPLCYDTTGYIDCAAAIRARIKS